MYVYTGALHGSIASSAVAAAVKDAGDNAQARMAKVSSGCRWHASDRRPSRLITPRAAVACSAEETAGCDRSCLLLRSRANLRGPRNEGAGFA